MDKDQKKKFTLGDINRKLEQDRKESDQGSRRDRSVENGGDRDHSADSASGFSPENVLPDQPQFNLAGASPEDKPKPAFNAPDQVRPAAAIAPAPSSPEAGKPAAAPPAPPSGSQMLSSDSADEGEEFDIYRYLSVLLRRKGIIVLSTIVVGLFSFYTFITGGRYYTAHARMLFNPGYQEIISDNVISFEAWGSREKKLNTHLNLLKSNAEVLKRVCDDVGGGVTPGVIQSGLIIERGATNGEKNDIIEMKFSNRDPEVARDIINSVCKTYISYIVEVNSQDITRMIIKFGAQIDKLKSELREKEDALRFFKEENRMVQMSSETEATVSKLSGMEVSLQQTDLDIIANKERFAALKAQMNQQELNIVQSVTYQDPYRKRLSELEFQLNTSMADLEPNHYKVQMLKQEMEHIKEIIKSNINKTIDNEIYVKNPVREQLAQQLVNLTVDQTSLEARRIALQEIIKRLSDQIVKLPAMEQKYATLQRETESLLAAEKMLEDQYEKIKIKRDSQECDLKVLEFAATPRTAFTNVKPSRIFVGMLVGLILGIALAFLLEYLDQTIKEIKDVERILEVPLLGVVPHLEGEKAILDFDSKKMKNKLEPFRSLRANLKHIAAANNLKTFMVCSAVKGEGKTTLTVNMAITFAMDGKKVIVIDGDLRRPQIHSLLSVPREIGLADYLLDEAGVEQVIKPTRYENLFAVTSGDRPHAPAELLGTIRFGQLLDELAQHADFVFLDSPAILPVSDAITMAPKIRGCIMVTRALWTPIKAARHARAQLKQIASPVLGAILNGVANSRGYYPYYYGYYRYYAYKYTYDYDEDHKEKNWRQFGLTIEAKLRDTLLDFRNSVPRYVGKAGRNLRYIARKKTFWALLMVFLGLTFSVPILKAKRHDRPLLQIQYLDKANTNAARTPAVAAANGGAPRGIPLESAGSAYLRAAAGDTATTAAPPDSTTLDGIFAAWQRAFEGKNVSSLLGFYDSAQFKYPGGGFSEWRTMVRDTLFGKIVGAASPAVESATTEQLGGSTAKTVMGISVPNVRDTLRMNCVQIWQNVNRHWRIVREKYRKES